MHGDEKEHLREARCSRLEFENSRSSKNPRGKVREVRAAAS